MSGGGPMDHVVEALTCRCGSLWWRAEQHIMVTPERLARTAPGCEPEAVYRRIVVVCVQCGSAVQQVEGVEPLRSVVSPPPCPVRSPTVQVGSSAYCELPAGHDSPLHQTTDGAGAVFTWNRTRGDDEVVRARPGPP